MENEHLLKTETGDDQVSVTIPDQTCTGPRKTSANRPRIWVLAILIHLALAVLYVITTLAILRSWNGTGTRDNASPRESFRAIDGLDVTHSHATKEIFEMTGFYGEPTAGMDQKWDDLLDARFIKVSGDELRRNGRDSIELQTGGPYLAWLGVFHELHCLDFVRRFVHREYYYPNITTAVEKRIQNHVDHCMDRVQAVIMCHPDYSTLTTMKWTDNPKPMVDGVRTLRSCVDWDVFMKSLQGRIVPAEELKALENPLLHE